MHSIIPPAAIAITARNNTSSINTSINILAHAITPIVGLIQLRQPHPPYIFCSDLAGKKTKYDRYGKSTEHNVSIIGMYIDSPRKLHCFVVEVNQVIVMATSRALATTLIWPLTGNISAKSDHY